MSRHNGTRTSSFGTKGRVGHNAHQFYSSRLYEGVKIEEALGTEENTIPEDIINTVICSSSESMKDLADNSTHLMITSPPYNVTKEYDNDLSLAEYLDMLKKVFTETYRVLVNGGRACINVANLGRRPYIPLSDYISKMMSDIGFNMRGEIIWNKAASAGVSTAWGSWMSASNPILRDVHEYILIFSKGNYKRELKKIEKKIKKNTISRENFIEWTKSTWQIGAESAKKIGHPAPFPVELPRRLIELYSFTEDIILDPFIGSGTTGVAALELERKFVGYETNQAYVNLAKKRTEPFLNQMRMNL